MKNLNEIYLYHIKEFLKEHENVPPLYLLNALKKDGEERQKIMGKLWKNDLKNVFIVLAFKELHENKKFKIQVINNRIQLLTT